MVRRCLGIFYKRALLGDNSTLSLAKRHIGSHHATLWNNCALKRVIFFSWAWKPRAWRCEAFSSTKWATYSNFNALAWTSKGFFSSSVSCLHSSPAWYPSKKLVFLCVRPFLFELICWLVPCHSLHSFTYFCPRLLRDTWSLSCSQGFRDLFTIFSKPKKVWCWRTPRPHKASFSIPLQLMVICRCETPLWKMGLRSRLLVCHGKTTNYLIKPRNEVLSCNDLVIVLVCLCSYDLGTILKFGKGAHLPHRIPWYKAGTSSVTGRKCCKFHASGLLLQHCKGNFFFQACDRINCQAALQSYTHS